MVNILEEPITLSILGGLFGLLILYVNNKIYKKENDRIEYLKLFFLIFVVVFIILQVFIFNKDNTGGYLTGGGGGYLSGGGDNLEIRGGHPNF